MGASGHRPRRAGGKWAGAQNGLRRNPSPVGALRVRRASSASPPRLPSSLGPASPRPPSRRVRKPRDAYPTGRLPLTKCRSQLSAKSVKPVRLHLTGLRPVLGHIRLGLRGRHVQISDVVHSSMMWTAPRAHCQCQCSSLIDAIPQRPRRHHTLLNRHISHLMPLICPHRRHVTSLASHVSPSGSHERGLACAASCVSLVSSRSLLARSEVAASRYPCSSPDVPTHHRASPRASRDGTPTPQSWQCADRHRPRCCPRAGPRYSAPASASARPGGGANPAARAALNVGQSAGPMPSARQSGVRRVASAARNAGSRATRSVGLNAGQSAGQSIDQSAARRAAPNTGQAARGWALRTPVRTTR